jgi:Protein of unknown function (DUF3054)
MLFRSANRNYMILNMRLLAAVGTVSRSVRGMRATRVLGWLGVDVACVLAFCAVGRRSHDEGLNVAGIAATAWPFLSGTALGWSASRGWRRPTALAPTGLVVWVCTVVIGMVLRKATSTGVAASFVVVASSVTALLLLGWRAAFLLFARKPNRTGR